MTPEQFATFEELSSNLQSPDFQQRSTAEKALQCFQTPAYLDRCRFVLENSSSPFSQLYGSSSMLKIFTDHWQQFKIASTVEIRNWLLAFLGNRGPQLMPFVLSSLILLLCRITKLGWLDEKEHQEITKPMAQFFQASPEHCIIGLQTFSQLVQEMNQPTGHSIAQHRKTAVSFRDKTLLHLFQTALSTLNQVHQRLLNITDARVEEQLKFQSLQLAFRCLSFDLINTTPDESLDDLGTVQLPVSWRGIIEESSTLQLFFDVYMTTHPLCSQMALECLVQFASIRRSLFSSEAEKERFLNQILIGISNILNNQTGLQDSANHHEFCRLLARLKSNYQLTQIVSSPCYTQWITLVANFTIATLRSVVAPANSVHYLLALWSRLVGAMGYLRGESPSLIDTFAPKVVEAYVASRVDSVKTIIENSNIDDPLDDEASLKDQLEALPYLARCSYPTTAELLISLLDPLSSTLEAFFVQQRENNADVELGQVAWLVYIISAIIGGRMGLGSSEEYDQLDGELASRIFRLMFMENEVLRKRAQAPPSNMENLELAFLYFNQQFRKVYIGDHMTSSSKIYVKITEMLGISDHLTILDFIVEKIQINLTYWAHSPNIVDHSLQLFHEITSSYNVNKLLNKRAITNQLLTHHTREYFPFLDQCAWRNRTLYYTSLGKLLFMENFHLFDIFIQPFSFTLDGLLSQNSVQTFRQETCKDYIIRVMRDLYGLVLACPNHRCFSRIFDWLYPKYTPVLHRAAEVWFDNATVIYSLLLFLAEFVCNKQQRLAFESSSPNGILLFRETSNILVAYGSRIVNYQPQNIYAEKYKGIRQSFTVLLNALSGSYVNFGVFALYNDPALSNALGVFFQLSLSIPRDHLMVYPKLQKAYFQLMEVLSIHHTVTLVELEPSVFVHQILNLKEGLSSTDTAVQAQCCSAFEHILEFLFNRSSFAGTNYISSSNKKDYTDKLAHYSELFISILSAFFRLVLQKECSNQWAISRPMLTLILVYPQAVEDLKQEISRNQPVEFQQKISENFVALMNNVENDLQSRNRDKFSQNLNKFCHDMLQLFANYFIDF